MRIKRPLLAVLLFLVTGILLFYHPDSDRKEIQDREKVTLVGEIDDIMGVDDKLSLTVRDVTYESRDLSGPDSPDDLSGESIGSILAYAGKSYTGETSCSFAELEIGNIISFSGTLKGFQSPGNPGQFDEITYYTSRGIAARM